MSLSEVICNPLERFTFWAIEGFAQWQIKSSVYFLWNWFRKRSTKPNARSHVNLPGGKLPGMSSRPSRVLQSIRWSDINNDGKDSKRLRNDDHIYNI